VARWVLGYHEQYREAPLKAIQGLFEENRGELDEGGAGWVAELLASVSRQFEEEGGPQAGNEAYLLDRTAAHFRKRALQVGAAKALKLLEAGRVDEAELLYAAALRSPWWWRTWGWTPSTRPRCCAFGSLACASG